MTRAANPRRRSPPPSAIGRPPSRAGGRRSRRAARRPGRRTAAEGLCLDLSALNLPSICIGSLLPPGVLSL